jgi:hypothetical protein
MKLRAAHFRLFSVHEGWNSECFELGVERIHSLGAIHVQSSECDLHTTRTALVKCLSLIISEVRNAACFLNHYWRYLTDFGNSTASRDPWLHLEPRMLA